MKRFVVALAVFVALPPVAAQESDRDRAIGARLPQDYSALRHRPLFSPDRKPPVPVIVERPPPVEILPPEPIEETVELPPAEPENAPSWQLIGVVRSPSSSSALFRDAVNGVFTLRHGENRDGWTLTRVDRFEVALDSEHARAFIRFSDER